MKNSIINKLKITAALVLSVTLAVPEGLMAGVSENIVQMDSEAVPEDCGHMEESADVQGEENELTGASYLTERPKYNTMMFDTTMRDHGSSNLSWAFANSSAMEISLRRSNPDKYEQTYHLSPDHMGYYFFNRVPDVLGLTGNTSVRPSTENANYYNNKCNVFNALFPLTSWMGPVNEKNGIFQNYAIHTSENYPADAAYAYGRDDVHVENAGWSSTVSVHGVKNIIALYGAAAVNINEPAADMLDKTEYEGREVYKYYNNNSYVLNYAVTLIGWDDTVSANEFTAADGVSHPSSDGAYIARNSKDPYRYLLIPYEDATLKFEGNRAVGFELGKSDNYDNIYNYDGGVSPHRVSSSGEIYGASVFKACGIDPHLGYEFVRAASFSTDSIGCSYEVSVYTGVDGGSGNPLSGTLAAAHSGTIEHAGYFTINFDKDVRVNEGEYYSIVVKISKDNASVVTSGTNQVTLMYDDNFGRAVATNWVVSNPGAAAGRSFLSKDGSSWSDTVSVPSDYVDNDVLSAGYVRIKAFTDVMTFSEEEAIKNIDVEYVDLSEEMVKDIDDQSYYGIQIKPETEVYYKDLRLTEGKDYQVSYGANNKAGKLQGTVTITGSGNYITKSPIVKKFNIKKGRLQDGFITVTNLDGISYTGGKVTPVTLSCNGVALKEGRDYEIKYSKNIKSGLAKFSVKGKGSLTGSLKGNFYIEEKDLGNLSVKEIPDQIYTGNMVRPEVFVTADDPDNKNNKKTLVLNKDYTVTYINNLAPTTGTSMAKAVVRGKGDYSGTKTVTFRIVKISFNDVSIKIDPEVSYTGEELYPEPVISYRSSILKKGVDYNLTYFNNISVGTAKILITGRNGSAFEGTTREINFKITPADLTKATVTGVGDLAYSGSVSEYKQNPSAIKIRLESGKYLNPSDYTITYSDNILTTPGNSTALVIFTAASPNVTGKLTKNFNIVYSSEKLIGDFTNTDVVLSGMSENREYILDTANMADTKGVRPPVALKYKGELLTEGVDYTLSYTDNTKIGMGTVTFTAIDGSGFYGKREEGFYIIGKPIYTPLDVKDNDFTITPPDNKPYTGSCIEPGVVITETTYTENSSGTNASGSRTLKEGKDYTITYNNNVDVGTATAVLKGIGNYSGTHTFRFNVEPANLDDLEADKIPDQIYTGEQISPGAFLINGGNYLVENRDVITSYGDNVSKGEGTVIFTAAPDQNNYKGTKTVNFKIIEAKLKDVKVEMPKSIYTLSEDAVCPPVTVYIDGIMLPETDYDVKYTHNDKIGVATAVINARKASKGGSGSLKGTIKKKFIIAGRPIDINAKASTVSMDYTGKKAKPIIESISCNNGEQLTLKTDFRIKTDKRINAGTGYATVTGQGMYKGSYGVVPYIINPVTVDSSYVVIDPVPDQTIKGAKPAKPELSIKVNKLKLLQGRDYVVTYENNTAKGNAKAYVHFVGNYKGSFVIDYVIN